MYLFKACFYPGICQGVVFLGHMGALFLVFSGSFTLFSIVAVPIYIPTNSVAGFPSLHTLSSFIVCVIFNDGHSDCYEVIQFSSVAYSYPTLCDPMDCNTTGFTVHHQLPELAQTHVHRVSDVSQPSHPLPSSSPPVFNLSRHQSLFQ